MGCRCHSAKKRGYSGLDLLNRAPHERKGKLWLLRSRFPCFLERSQEPLQIPCSGCCPQAVPALYLSKSLLPREFGRFPVLLNLCVVNRHLGPMLDISVVIVQRLIVEASDDDLPLIVANFHPNPHPLPDACGFIRKFYFHVIAALVGRHFRSQICYFTSWFSHRGRIPVVSPFQEPYQLSN